MLQKRYFHFAHNAEARVCKTVLDQESFPNYLLISRKICAFRLITLIVLIMTDSLAKHIFQKITINLDLFKCAVCKVLQKKFGGITREQMQKSAQLDFQMNISKILGSDESSSVLFS